MRTIRYFLQTLLASALSLTLLCMTAGLVLAIPAHSTIPAHAKVNKADPGINSTVNKAPTKVTVFTEENMDPSPAKSNLIVYGPSSDATDTVISQGNAQVPVSNPKEMSINITPNKGHVNGVYVVYWKTVSTDDGDPADGAFTFTVNTSGASTSSTATATSNNTSSGLSIWVPIVAALVALLVGLGVGLGLGRRRSAPAVSQLGAMRSTLTEELKKE
jgi:methionine-rich copper-binding protein CopC